MAWPLTPLTTYIAGMVPAIKAFDLNKIQDAINQILLGTYSHKTMVVDGIGGAEVVGTDGAVFVNADAAGTSLPTPGFSTGTLYADSLVNAWGVVAATGTDNACFVRGANVVSIAHTATTGVYDITLGTPLSSTSVVAMATSRDPGIVCICTATSTSVVRVITTVSSTGMNQDARFSFLVIGS